MFNVGDIIQCTNPNLVNLTFGRHYIVESISCPYLRVKDNHGTVIGYHRQNFTLVVAAAQNSPTPNTPNPAPVNVVSYKYKLGDKVRYMGPSQVNFKTGEKGIITDIKGVITVTLDSGVLLICCDYELELITSKPAHKFNIGDTVKDNSGNIASIDQVDISVSPPIYAMTIIAPGFGRHSLGQKSNRPVDIIDKTCHLVIGAKTLPPNTRDSNPMAIADAMTKPPSKPCTCDSHSLFLKGCNCGAIVKRKWGL